MPCSLSLYVCVHIYIYIYKYTVCSQLENMQHVPKLSLGHIQLVLLLQQKDFRQILQILFNIIICLTYVFGSFLKKIDIF